MKLTLLFVGLGLLLPGIACGQATTVATTGTPTNAAAVSDGWLQVPGRELVLDVQQDSLEYGARRDAGEFIAAVLEVLLGANYTVRLGDQYIQEEIDYYRENLNLETPVEMGKSVLSCLEKARASGILDWECFKGDFMRHAEPTAAQWHLPWMAPPYKATAVSLAGPASTNLACLHLSLKWNGLSYGGAVQHTRRPGGLMGETVLTEGSGKLWAFSAVQLTKPGQTLFEKGYPREEWQRAYVTIYERPLWKTSQAILQDLATGVKLKPELARQPVKEKRRK